MAVTAPLIARKKLLGGKEETDSGTFVGLNSGGITTAFASTGLYDIKLEPVGLFSEGRRQPDGNYLGNVDAVRGKLIGKLSFRQELRHGDKFVPMLTGAGFKSVTGNIFKPTSNMADRKTWSFAVWEDGRVKRLAGAAGTCTLEGTNGGRVFANWEWQGVLVLNTGGVWMADATMPAQAPLNAAPYVANAVTLTLGGSAVPYSSRFTIDLGNEVVERADLAARGGVLHYLVGERGPTLKLDTEARKVADGDALTALLGGGTAALSLVLRNGAETLTIGAPRVQRTDVGDGERNKLLVDDQTFQCNAENGDDELTFVESA